METEFKAKVDTIQVTTAANNVINIEEWYGGKSFVKENSAKLTEKEGIKRITVVLHPSRMGARYDASDEMYRYSSYRKMKKQMLKELTVVLPADVKLDRMDICLDTSKGFKEMYKLSNAITGLYALEKKADKVWKNVDYWSERTNGFNVAKQCFGLTIYDKELESGGRHPYKTRVEFKFTKLGNVEEVKKIDELITLFDRLADNLEMLESIKAEKLFVLYQEQLSDGKIKNFTQFVAMNQDNILTSNMCKILYEKVGLKGNYTKWLSKYRQANSIEFVTKTDIRNVMAAMKKAVKEFKRS